MQALTLDWELPINPCAMHGYFNDVKHHSQHLVPVVSRSSFPKTPQSGLQGLASLFVEAHLMPQDHDEKNLQWQLRPLSSHLKMKPERGSLPRVHP